MFVPEYCDEGATPIPSHLNLETLQGKSVIITGGANGLGKAYAEAFVKARAYVTIADFNETAGKQTVSELSSEASQFVKCDVRSWDDQVLVFEAAIKNSPFHSCDIVIANAGIVGVDDLYKLEDPNSPPVKPDLRIIDINLIGLSYTAKLALHYFRRQPLSPIRDRCLIIKGSIASYADQPGSPQYNISKWGARGLMRNLRRTTWKEGIRVNLVAPWYVRTPILSKDIQDYLDGKGVGFALVEDSAKAMLKIASDASINGRAFGIVSRKDAPEGYMDLDHDDYKDGDILKGWQEIVLDTAHRIVVSARIRRCFFGS
ncbi:short chain dehydrogenase reductase [Talaromyces proteolyticus]|uniref:Short chain dehydrogenase reductase n=1 Tax=Talaromyces proteolyticus TaxID=1131652 RepID=A0AAD4Q2N2_9EURO|nr:short chain dehydrogenase reductase [Talaromyces proteolyticus]KAH8703862.1 short chain dehydrogenase reductase [Talaromyces proteolyticus]